MMGDLAIFRMGGNLKSGLGGTGFGRLYKDWKSDWLKEGWSNLSLVSFDRK